MSDAGRQIWKIRVPKDVELTPLEDKNEQEQTKNTEKGIKKTRKSKKNEWKREMNEGTTKSDPSCIPEMIPWSNHPETQFGSIYPFFRNHEPWPTLHTKKSIWIECGYLDWRGSSLRIFLPKSSW